LKNFRNIIACCLFVSLVSCESQSDNNSQSQSVVFPASTRTGPVPIVGTPLNANNNYSSTPAGDNAQVTLNPQHGQPGHRCDLAVGAPLPSYTSNNSTSSPNGNEQVTLNPQHGQPGHRCDLAVGAPLPVTGINNLTQSLKAENVSNITTTTNNTASGLNPKHGEPGHRCDIAVGSPLSQPVKTNAQSVSVPTGATNNKLEYNPFSNTALTVAPGMNPKHGQPGHRCDIAVGAPLTDTSNIKTAQTLKAINDSVDLVENNSSSNSIAGLNPKHGEPGHRCDIAVGAPLNSETKQ